MHLISVQADGIKQLTRSIVYAGIWISFILNSEKVKRIFVYPHN
ncbi:DUF2569 family protein [Pedobacter sp.]